MNKENASDYPRVFIALKEDLRFLPILPVAFSYLHFSYGIGFLHGIFDFIIRRKKKTGEEKRFET